MVMTSTTVTLGNLQDSERWKAEFFCGEIRAHRSRFDVAPIASLVSERREFINPQDYADHEFHYFGLEHVESETGDLVGYQSRVGRKVRSRSKVFRPNDILYGRLRPYLNKVLLVTDNVGSGICSNEFLVLIPDVDVVNPLYLRSVLASSYVSRRTADLQTGSALPRLQLSDLLEIEVPVPPMAVQLEIANLARTINENRARMRARIEQEQRLFLSSLVDVLRDEVPMPSYEKLALAVESSVIETGQLPAQYAPRPRSRP
jgi:hypothetical protein